jgi:hypothetical protein
MKQFANIDVQAMYPAGAPPKAENWTLDTFMKAAEACFKGGKPFGIGVGNTGDSNDTIGAIFHSYGAMLCNEKGEITVKSDAVRQALDFYKKLMQFLPGDVAAWDDASNNKFLISGQASLIMNPPSAWAVAKRDAPQVAEQCWTHGFPAGPKGRFAPFVPFFWGIWNFSKNSPGGQEPAHAPVAARVDREDGGRVGRLRPAVVREADDVQGVGRGGAAQGHALPLSQPVQSPDPVGRRRARAAQDRRADQHASIQCQMAVRYYKGEALEKTLAWAANEVEGFMRN